MSGSMNWMRVKSRAQMRRQGIEDKKGEPSLVDPLKKRPRKYRPAASKAEQRAEAEKALAEWKARKGGQHENH
jgi:hypothetical protein